MYSRWHIVINLFRHCPLVEIEVASQVEDYSQWDIQNRINLHHKYAFHASPHVPLLSVVFMSEEHKFPVCRSTLSSTVNRSDIDKVFANGPLISRVN